MPVLEAPRWAVSGNPQDAGHERSHGMDGTRTLLELVLANKLAEGRLRGLFHIAIGRRVTSIDGTVLATGTTWRELATLLKTLKFEKEWVRALGADPETLAPRDREKFWYHVIALALVDSQEARAEAEALASFLRPLGWIVGPPPTAISSRPSPPPPRIPDPSEVETPAPRKPKPKKK